MIHLKLYIQGCALFLVSFIVVGFFVPCLLSSNDALNPFLGVIFLLMVPPAVWFFIRHVIATLKEEREANAEREKARADRRSRR